MQNFDTLNILIQAIQELLKKDYQISFQDSDKSYRQIASCVQQLSDYYIQNPNGSTPWHEKWTQISYLAYYLPLNYVRAERVFTKAQQLGFFNIHSQLENTDIKSKASAKDLVQNDRQDRDNALANIAANVVDFGSGLGSGTWPLFLNASGSLRPSSATASSSTAAASSTATASSSSSYGAIPFTDFSFIEVSTDAQKLHQKLFNYLQNTIKDLDHLVINNVTANTISNIENKKNNKQANNRLSLSHNRTLNWYSDINSAMTLPVNSTLSSTMNSSMNSKTNSSSKKIINKNTFAFFSYSLTELASIPNWALDCEGLVIIEPSTNQDARRLMAWRDLLLSKGFHIWGPCLHEEACPLLTESKKDWCHDRIDFQQRPESFKKIESFLPFKNESLTCSYILARKTPRPSTMLASAIAVAAVSASASAAEASAVELEVARVTGDLLNEKGKSRQLICRGPKREFLTWMHKNGEPQQIPRGELILLPQNLQTVSNELRIVGDNENSITVLTDDRQ